MNIAFDAKRAFHNDTGLGHYSRTLIKLLAEHHPTHQYFLFNPKPSGTFSIKGNNIHEVQPTGFLSRMFSSAWRSSWVKNDLQKHSIDLYHGLSHEIPVGIQQTGIKSVVTIHDLIHERYPEQYSAIDVKIYSKKFRYACEHANRIIAISKQTERDIVDFYKISPEKISVCYQSCSPAFGERVDNAEKARIAAKFNLPRNFFLYVGSIIERKNLLNVCKAMFLLRNDVDLPLVVVGNGGKYKQQVVDFIRQHDLEKKVLFLSEHEGARTNDFKIGKDLPAIYQMATCLLYPSYFEGFGIPVLEALWSRLPVITSNVSCLPEAGGDAAYYVNPTNATEMAEGMKKIWSDPEFAETLREKGWKHAQNFRPETYADNVMNIYTSL